MNPRLRTRRNPDFAPVAAEVLETRALLSAGAAVAHAATHHAEIQVQAVQPHAFHGKLTAEIVVGAALLGDFPLRFSISNVSTTVGSTVTAHAAFSANDGNSKTKIKATFIGTVQSTAPHGPATDVFLTPTGGSIVLTFKQGKKQSVETALPDGSLMDALVQGNSFSGFTAKFTFTADSAPPFNGRSCTFSVFNL